jgi:hypothetical protein
MALLVETTLDICTGKGQNFVSFQRPEVHTMPARRIPIKPAHRNMRSNCAKSTAAQLKLVLNAIEQERDNLSRAESLLGCLAVAMEYGDISPKGPYYPDVAQIARQMVRRSIGALDPINLPDPSRDKVKEDLQRGEAPLLLAVPYVPLLPPQTCAPTRPCSLRIHRRNYSRVLARVTSSKDSASANISG